MKIRSRQYYLNQILNRNSEVLYDKHPEGSLSVGEDKTCLSFRDYLDRWLLPGESLDVGCGPQYKPAYIPKGLFSWIGLDPLPGEWFDKRLVGEIENLFFPIAGYRFNNIVFATSLDHCYDPMIAIRRSWQALNDNGHLIIWTSIRPGLRTRLVWWKELWKARRIKFINNIPFYVPLGCPDPFHRRYLTIKQIMRWTKGLFRLVNIEEQPNRNVFLCFEKR